MPLCCPAAGLARDVRGGGHPAPVVAKPSAKISRILRVPDVAAKIDGFGMTVGGSTPEEVARTLPADSVVYARIIKAANIRPNQ